MAKAFVSGIKKKKEAHYWASFKADSSSLFSAITLGQQVACLLSKKDIVHVAVYFSVS